MNAYEELMIVYKDISIITEISSQLSWDQHTYMPRKAAAMRGGQNAFLSKLSHKRLTSERVGRLLSELEGMELDENRKAVVREIRRIYERKTAIPAELEAEIAAMEPISMQSWVEAKNKGDFSIFAPNLEKMLELKKEVAEKVGYEEIPYDALLEDYEPYTRTSQLRGIFKDLRKELVPIIEKIISQKSKVIPFEGSYPRNSQEELYTSILVDMGYDFEAGRLDTTEHPFTIGSGNDTRITTHYYENDPRPALFSCIHEGGHALYEQGYLVENMHTPLGEFCSLGIHESQSRMWENLIGRSLPFWKHYYPRLEKTFPSLSSMGLNMFYRAINQVRPSLIRVEADEATYNLHVLIRFEIEIDIFDGKLELSEIPQAWNDKYEEYLGIRPPNDGVGCLQDVHWSMGAFGYFPTYTLGNLYASQFFHRMKRDLDVDGLMEAGDLKPILSWLRTNIHHKGKLYPASELVKVVTGSSLDGSYFIDHLKSKFGSIYGVSF
jgi:carboxypeptidase Taq